MNYKQSKTSFEFRIQSYMHMNNSVNHSMMQINNFFNIPNNLGSSKRSPSEGGRMIEEGRVPTGPTPSPRIGRRSTLDGPLGGICGGFHGKLACTGVVILSVLIFTSVVIVDSIHTIEEGSIGLYFVQGALSDRVSPPGVHWAIPFVTQIESVTIRPKTDTLPSIR